MPRSRFTFVSCCAALLCTLATSPAAAYEPAARADIEQAIDVLRDSNPKLRVVYGRGQLGPSVLTGIRLPTDGATPRARADDFLERMSIVLGVPSTQLAFVKVTATRDRNIVRYRQVTGDQIVHGRVVALTLDAEGFVISISSDAHPVSEVLRGELSDDDARKSAAAAALGTDDHTALPPAPARVERVVIVNGNEAFEAARVLVATRGGAAVLEVLIDTRTGKVASVRPVIKH